MKSLLKRLGKLGEDDLHALSEAIDTELDCRMEREDTIPVSARRRVIQRGQSYRHANGSSALPIRMVGTPQQTRRRRIAA